MKNLLCEPNVVVGGGGFDLMTSAKCKFPIEIMYSVIKYSVFVNYANGALLINPISATTSILNVCRSRYVCIFVCIDSYVYLRISKE